MGAFLQLVGYWLFPESDVMAVLVALFTVIAISYGFELFSLLSGWGHYDFHDAVASVIGGVLGMGMAIWGQYEFGLVQIVVGMTYDLRP